MRTSTAITASTSRMWMNPPKVYELTMPSSHKIRSTTAIVQSIVVFFSALDGLALQAGVGAFRGQRKQNVRARLSSIGCRHKQFCARDYSEHLHDAIADGVSRQVGHRVQAQFAHEIGTVSFRRLDAQIEGDGHLFAGLSLRQQLNDFALTRGQDLCGIVPLEAVTGLFAIEKTVQNHLTDTSGEKCTLALQGFHGGHQITARVRLEQITSSTSAQYFTDHIV